MLNDLLRIGQNYLAFYVAFLCPNIDSWESKVNIWSYKLIRACSVLFSICCFHETKMKCYIENLNMHLVSFSKIILRTTKSKTRLVGIVQRIIIGIISLTEY